MSTHRAVAPLVISVLLTIITCSYVFGQAANRWRITSIKLCKSSGGTIFLQMDAVGSYPVYSFFIPRPTWTVNGTVVDAKPTYDNGRLVAFQLLNAASLLNPGVKNTVKFALPDHNGSLVFIYDHSRIPAGECYEFF